MIIEKNTFFLQRSNSPAQNNYHHKILSRKNMCHDNQVISFVKMNTRVMADNNHLQNPGFFAMNLNLRRFEILGHGEVQYRR